MLERLRLVCAIVVNALWKICFLQPHPLHFGQRDVVPPAVVELRRAGGGVVRHRRVLQRAAILRYVAMPVARKVWFPMRVAIQAPSARRRTMAKASGWVISLSPRRLILRDRARNSGVLCCRDRWHRGQLLVEQAVAAHLVPLGPPSRAAAATGGRAARRRPRPSSPAPPRSARRNRPSARSARGPSVRSARQGRCHPGEGAPPPPPAPACARFARMRRPAHRGRRV